MGYYKYLSGGHLYRYIQSFSKGMFSTKINCGSTTFKAKGAFKYYISVFGGGVGTLLKC